MPHYSNFRLTNVHEWEPMTGPLCMNPSHNQLHSYSQPMDQESFSRNLAGFSTILVDHINCPVQNSYVRASSLGNYLFLSVETTNGTLDLTVHYDSFYQVPVLYYLKNKQLKMEEGALVDIHPILQSPYQMVHPCETQEIMASVGWNSEVDYLIRWFGIHIEQVLTEIQLRVPT